MRSILLAAISTAAIACGGSKPSGPPVGLSGGAPTPSSEATVWAFDSLDARPITSETMRGKPVVLVFVVTDNLACQAQVNFVVAMAKHDAESVHYVLVDAEPRAQREMFELYAKSLGVTFPAAMADEATMRGGGPFPLQAVPTVIVLDRAGRAVWRTTGLAKPEEIRAHLNGR